ncbi:MAG: enoyl-CoA hydratase/isomerase family protein [Solirubrobacteraceae bacterium]|nr:enoyl-CoA hydratase/isomerase family protein [Solirubrobacteraceae bacterium]
MTGERPILTTIDDGLATIALVNPSGANAMTPHWGECFLADIDRIAADDSVRVVLLRAEGRAFCVGGDLASFGGTDDPKSLIWNLAQNLHAGMQQLAALDAPLVASVQGAAAGAGMSLVCAADLAIASESASFTAAYTAAGLSPDGGMSWTLPRLVGERRAAEMLLTNRRVAGAEAAEIGLVNACVADDALVDHTAAVVGTLLRGSRTSFGVTRRLLRSSASNTIEAQMALEAEGIAGLAGGPGGREGISAFLEKRRPAFPV